MILHYQKTLQMLQMVQIGVREKGSGIRKQETLTQDRRNGNRLNNETLTPVSLRSRTLPQLREGLKV